LPRSYPDREAWRNIPGGRSRKRLESSALRSTPRPRQRQITSNLSTRRCPVQEKACLSHGLRPTLIAVADTRAARTVPPQGRFPHGTKTPASRNASRRNPTYYRTA
jgi:hypothetical protein